MFINAGDGLTSFLYFLLVILSSFNKLTLALSAFLRLSQLYAVSTEFTPTPASTRLIVPSTRMMGFFDNRFKFPVHMVQLVLAVGVLIVAIVRMMNMPSGVPTGRSGTMALGMVRPLYTHRPKNTNPDPNRPQSPSPSCCTRSSPSTSPP